MVDDKRGPVVKRAPGEEENAAGLTLPLVLSLLFMRVSIRGAVTTPLNKLCVTHLAVAELHMILP